MEYLLFIYHNSDVSKRKKCFYIGVLNMKISLLCCRCEMTYGYDMFLDLDPALGR